MTPKEKATEIYNNMLAYCWHNEFPIGNYGVCKKVTIFEKDKAKECAQLCVKEIINVLNGDPIFHEGLIKYWKEVKQEIKKL